jgi:hypothetical protein
MNVQTRRYELEETPLNPVDGGTSLLVSGPRDAGLDTLVHRLLAGDDEEGTVGITSDDDGARFRRAHRREAGHANGRSAAIVDCSGERRGGASGPPTNTDENTVVADPADLTAVNMQFSSLCDDLRFDGVERVRTGLVSVSPLCAACEDMRDVYRFVQNITSRNRRSDGLFVCAIDPDADVGDFNSGQSITEGLSRAFGGHVELRADGRDAEVRVEGLDDQPAGWQTVAL